MLLGTLLPWPARATEILPLDEVRPGMKGYGLSVFRGQAVDRFDVEVLGIMKNIAPARSMIVVRIAGQDLENAGVIAGMSGSPVYIDGKVIGAVSSGWSFAKVPIGGVTPIEDMLRIESEAIPSASPKKGVPHGSGSQPLSAAVQLLASGPGLSPEEFVSKLKTEVTSRYALPRELRAQASVLTAPVASGFSASTFESFSELLPFDRSFAVPLASGMQGASTSSQTPAGPLQPGSSIAAMLVSGDLSLGATGTVSYVYPDGRFLAFGHPFLGFGDLEIPVALSPVVSVLPNLFQSFKIASPGQATYRLRRDRDTGISGGPGTGAPTVPVQIRFSSEGGQRREVNVEVTSHSKLLPSMTALVVDSSLNSLDSSPRERTSSFEIKIETAAGPFRYADEFAGIRAREIVALTTALLTGAIADNEFQDPGIKRISLDVRSRPGETRWRLSEASLGVRRVRPGDKVPVMFRTSGRRDDERTHTLILEIPKETPEGRAAIWVTDGSAASALRLASAPSEPRSLEDFRKILALLTPSNEAVVLLTIPSRGATTGSGVLSALPPTAAALLSSGRNSGETGSADVETRILSEALKKLPAPVAGSIRIDIEIEAPKN